MLLCVANLRTCTQCYYWWRWCKYHLTGWDYSLDWTAKSDNWLTKHGLGVTRPGQITPYFGPSWFLNIPLLFPIILDRSTWRCHHYSATITMTLSCALGLDKTEHLSSWTQTLRLCQVYNMTDPLSVVLLRAILSTKWGGVSYSEIIILKIILNFLPRSSSDHGYG